MWGMRYIQLGAVAVFLKIKSQVLGLGSGPCKGGCPKGKALWASQEINLWSGQGPEHSQKIACLFCDLVPCCDLVSALGQFDLGLLLEIQANDGKSLYPQGMLRWLVNGPLLTVSSHVLSSVNSQEEREIKLLLFYKTTGPIGSGPQTYDLI